MLDEIPAIHDFIRIFYCLWKVHSFQLSIVMPFGSRVKQHLKQRQSTFLQQQPQRTFALLRFAADPIAPSFLLFN